MKPPKCKSCGKSEWNHTCTRGDLTQAAVEKALKTVKKKIICLHPTKVITDGVSLTGIPHPKRRGRPPKKVQRSTLGKAALETMEIEIRKPSFDRKAYQKDYIREYMRKRRAADKLKLSKG